MQTKRYATIQQWC